MSKDKRYSDVVRCEHCGNRAPMEIVESYSQLQHKEDEATGEPWEAGYVYDLLECPSCSNVVLRRYFWRDDMEPLDVVFSTLYPTSTKSPIGLPDAIKTAYQAALNVRPIDANAYGVLIGRLLEMVCEDRSAQGNSLNEKLADLASRQEIPTKLVAVATKLRHFRNVAAHAVLGELTAEEIPILDDLTRAILEYVYSAPHLVDQADRRLQALKKKSAQKPKGA
jgi:hypothetical protein